MDKVGKLEYKTFPFTDLKVSDQGVVEGYAAVFHNVDLGGDIIEPGAFKETLTKRGLAGVKVFIGHAHGSLPVGLPLELREDKHGLFTRTQLFDSTGGRDVLATAKGLAVGEGDGLGMSIAYAAEEFEFDTVNDQQVRRLKRLDLPEYSFVGMPMNAAATVTSAKCANCQKVEVKGQRLTSLLNTLIDGRDGDREDVIEAMGSAAGISASTVSQILRNEITCPPEARLRGFARALGTSFGRLRSAAEADGCDYDGEASSAQGIFEARRVSISESVKEAADIQDLLATLKEGATMIEGELANRPDERLRQARFVAAVREGSNK